MFKVFALSLLLMIFSGWMIARDEIQRLKTELKFLQFEVQRQKQEMKPVLRHRLLKNQFKDWV